MAGGSKENWKVQDPKEQQDKFLVDIISSKSLLSFGYRQHYWLDIKILLSKCFKTNYKRSMTYRKYQRSKNGEAKLAEETDLITILKTLRSARFLINQKMS